MDTRWGTWDGRVGANVLWDGISLIDDATIEAVHSLGGLAAIAISHPHYFIVDGRVESGPRRRAVLPPCRR
jgi:hypothetical protein